MLMLQIQLSIQIDWKLRFDFCVPGRMSDDLAKEEWMETKDKIVN